MFVVVFYNICSSFLPQMLLTLDYICGNIKTTYVLSNNKKEKKPVEKQKAQKVKYKKNFRNLGGTVKYNTTTWVCQQTGEIVEAAEILKPIGRRGFMITYLETLIDMIEVMGSARMKVVKYILANMDTSSNTLIATTREIADKLGTSTKTVTESLKLMENCKLITRRTGIIMINPKLLHKGNENKERALLTRFYQFEHPEGEEFD